ncbi:unnamed protein product [Lota lota]
MMGSAVTGGNRKKSQTLRGVDPDTCMMVFKNHWTQVVKILDKHEPSRCGALSFFSGLSGASPGGGGGGVLRLPNIPTDEAIAVHNYVEHMLYLLMEEEPGQGGAMGPILELVVVEGVMERLFLWSLRKHFTVDLKLEQLRMYQMLLVHARQPLLHHKPILKPLMVLLASCAENTTDGGGQVEQVEQVERELVSLLQQLCVSLVRDPSVLELFFHSTQDQGAANFLLFSLLIPYTHRQGPVGEQARSSLLLIMSLSALESRVTQHIVEHTYFCPVLATGLSGLYSALPAKLQVYSEDWHSLEEADWVQVPALVHFLHSLEFCSAVIKVAHPSIRCQLLGYIYNGFLVPVLAPALHKLTVEEVMTTTAYLDVFLRCVSEPALLHTFLSFILLHTHDHVHILDTLVSRINTPFQLGVVSLALFRTLIGLFCEDVMLQLVLRYLIPCEHLGSRGRSLLLERDCYSSSASCFLLLTPSCCPLRPPLSPHQTTLHPHSEHIHWPKGSGVSEGDSVAYCRSSDFLIQANYLHYLWEARLAICTSTRACRTWSAPYDGFRPLPQEGERGGGEAGEENGGQMEERGGGEGLGEGGEDADTFPVGNEVERRISTYELEWDDMFRDDDPSPMSSSSGVTEPPRHIQEMRRSATVLLRGGGAYAEESDFQDDVLVYHLVALRDARTPGLLEPDTSLLADTNMTMALAPPQVRSVAETVNNIMSPRRQSEDATREERRRKGGEETRRIERGGRRSQSLVNGFKVFNQDCNAHPLTQQRKHLKPQDHAQLNTHQDTQLTTHYNTHQDAQLSTHYNTHQDAQLTTHYNTHQDAQLTTHYNTHQDAQLTTRHNTRLNTYQKTHQNPHHNTHRDTHRDTHNTESLVADDVPGDSFLSAYLELMLWSGRDPNADPDDHHDNDPSDLITFRRRVQALRKKQEEEGLEEEVDFNSWKEEEEEEEEERRSGSREQGNSFTGPFLSVLLSRLENLLDNSISVNLLLTGILAQLASYPQPLLRSFLLNTHTLSTRTLYQVLSSVRVQIENYMSDRPDYVSIVTQAWRFLLAKHQRVGGASSPGPGHDKGPRKLKKLNQIKGPQPHWHGGHGPVVPLDKTRVFAIILFGEFLKELAALAQEHSITP